MQVVNSYVNMGINVLSTNDLFEALQTSGGMKNTFIFLFTMNNEYVESMCNSYKTLFMNFLNLQGSMKQSLMETNYTYMNTQTSIHDEFV